MSETRWAFRNLRTGEVAPARNIDKPSEPVRVGPANSEASRDVRGHVVIFLPGGGRIRVLPDARGEVVPYDWMFGTIDPTGRFRPEDHSVSYILKFPSETTAELDELIKETGGDATELFKKAIGLYKLARDAVHEGKAVGVASSPDCLETEFVGI